jgi:hypothetical protein
LQLAERPNPPISTGVVTELRPETHRITAQPFVHVQKPIRRLERLTREKQLHDLTLTIDLPAPGLVPHGSTNPHAIYRQLARIAHSHLRPDFSVALRRLLVPRMLCVHDQRYLDCLGSTPLIDRFPQLVALGAVGVEPFDQSLLCVSTWAAISIGGLSE